MNPKLGLIFKGFFFKLEEIETIKKFCENNDYMDITPDEIAEIIKEAYNR